MIDLWEECESTDGDVLIRKHNADGTWTFLAPGDETAQLLNDLEARSCWTPCSEAMPTDDAPVEFVAGLDHRALATGRRTKAPAITDLIWWADDGTLWADKFVTHWRPWSGWPGKEG